MKVSDENLEKMIRVADAFGTVSPKDAEELIAALRELQSYRHKHSIDLIERVAQLVSHRACLGVEHDPQNGKMHGWCVVCGDTWPCEYAGKPPAPSESNHV